MNYIIKAGGAVCIIATCSAVGIILRQRLTDRADCLEKLVAMLDFFSAQISYARMPVGEIVSRMAALGQFQTLAFLGDCAARLRRGTSFPEAWKQSAVCEKRLLDQEDYERLLSLGECLGITDAQEQEKTIALYTRMFSVSCERARTECAAHAKMYTTLGVLAGLGLTILIL